MILVRNGLDTNTSMSNSVHSDGKCPGHFCCCCEVLWICNETACCPEVRFPCPASCHEEDCVFGQRLNLRKTNREIEEAVAAERERCMKIVSAESQEDWSSASHPGDQGDEVERVCAMIHARIKSGKGWFRPPDETRNA